MGEVRDGLRYAKSHEWVKLDGDTATIGITDHAQHELTDVVFVELPKVGAAYKAGESFGVVESVKSVSDLYVPMSGTVTAVNTKLDASPELVNESPYDDGWMIKLQVKDRKEIEKLLAPAAYQKETGH